MDDLQVSEHQVTALVLEGLPKTGYAERLAGRTAYDQVDGPARLGPLDEIVLRDVPEVGDAWEPVGQDRGGELLVLAEPGRLPSERVPRHARRLNPAEKASVSHSALLL